MNDLIERALTEANFLLSKHVGDAQGSAIEHLAGAILLAAVIQAKARSNAAGSDEGSKK